MLLLGNSQVGKSTVLRRLLAEPYDGITLIHDDSKNVPQYADLGPVVADFSLAPDDARIVTLRGDPFLRQYVEVDQLAALALDIVRAPPAPDGKRLKVRAVIDEWDRAMTPGGNELVGEHILEAQTKGGSMGLSVFGTTQIPKRARAIMDQCTHVLIFQVGRAGVNYLDERVQLDGDILDVPSTLPVGEFVLYEQGRPWNGIVYFNDLVRAAKPSPASAPQQQETGT